MSGWHLPEVDWTDPRYVNSVTSSSEWSQTDGQGVDSPASSHIIWCKISLSSPKLLTFFRNSRWRPPPSWIFSLCIFGHSDVLIVHCTKFGSNICYSHWDWHTYATDVHLMTSRELTSGFDFWSRAHLRIGRVASSHIIWSKISLSSPKLLTFFRNSRRRPPPSWIFSFCQFGHPGVLIVWYLCSVPNLVSNICYSDWDRRTHASDLH